MGYQLKETPTKAPAPGGGTQVQQEGGTKKAPNPDDLVPAENKAAKGGGPDDEKSKADEAEKKKHEAVVKAKWEGLLGKWLGSKLAPLVLEHVSIDALNGYVQEGLKAAAPGIHDAIKKETKPEKSQEKALKAWSDAFSGILTGQVEKWVASEKGQKILKGISGWVEDNPGWVMGIVGTAVIGGAIAAWMANPDLPNIEVPLGLGKGWEAKAGIDLGTLQTLGFQAASLAVANKTKKITMKAEVKKDEEEKDGEVVKTTKSASLAIKKGDKGKEELTFALNGKIVETADGLVAHSVGGDLFLRDPDNGVTVKMGANGKWDNKGNKEDVLTYSINSDPKAKTNGKLSFNVKNATVVDADGNIHSVSSSGIQLAVGDKANKFSLDAKTETKDGQTTSSAAVSGQAQLGAGTLFKGNAGVKITEGETIVTLGGDMTATVGGKKISFGGTYETDGKITGKVKLGEGEEYTEVTGTKTGNVVTFNTAQVFKGGKIEHEYSKGDNGDVAKQTTATVAAGAHAVTMSGGDKGASVGYQGKNLGGKGIDVNAKASETEQSVGVKYKEGQFSAELDMLMKQGTGSLGGALNYKGDNLSAYGNFKVGEETAEFGTGFKFEKDGYLASADLKLGDSRVQELGFKLGYKDPKEFKSFLVGYKQKWQGDNKGAEHSFDALLEYSVGKWSARASGEVSVMGNRVQKTKLDLGLAYDLNDKWKAIGGIQQSGQFNTGSGEFDQSYKPYVGAQYGNIGVAGFYDTGSQAGGIMLTIPFGR